MEFKSSDRSSFPYQIINGVAEEFTEVYVSRLEVPAEFMYMAFLTCLGSLLACRATLKTEIRPQPRLYTLLLGESADGRKSTAIDKTVEFFRFALRNLENWPWKECWGVGSAEGLAGNLYNKKDVTTKINLLLCYDEFKGFVSKAKIKSSTLLECVNSLYEKNLYENQTKKTGVFIKNAYLSMIAASTLQTYESIWDKSFTDIGFFNRLFIIPGAGPRKDVMPPVIPLREKQILTNELLSLLDFIGPFKEFGIDDSAYSALQDWYLNRPKSIHSKRLDGYALRLLILMAANKKQSMIDDQMVDDVISLVNWQFDMRQMYDPIDADNSCAKLEEKIRRTLNRRGPITERELKQLTNATRTGLWLFKTALGNLRRESGEVIFDKKSKKWMLNS